MRTPDIEKNHKDFDEQIQDQKQYLERMFRAKRVVKRGDKVLIAEAAILRLCAAWEAFVDEELTDCLSLNSSTLATSLGLSLRTHLDRNLCRAILFRDRYLDFPNIASLKKFAKNHLCPSCNPFQHIGKDSTRLMDEMFVMRNYLAHKSEASRRALLKSYRKNHPLDRFERPGNFLLAYRASRMFRYVAALRHASAEMINGL